MTDQGLIIEAIEEAQRILGEYIAPGSRNDAATIKALLEVLDRRDVVAALTRLSWIWIARREVRSSPSPLFVTLVASARPAASRWPPA
jgi:hypothetical protein